MLTFDFNALISKTLEDIFSAVIEDHKRTMNGCLGRSERFGVWTNKDGSELERLSRFFSVVLDEDAKVWSENDRENSAMKIVLRTKHFESHALISYRMMCQEDRLLDVFARTFAMMVREIRAKKMGRRDWQYRVEFS